MQDNAARSTLRMFAASPDLELRLSLATPADSARGMFFNGALNAMRIAVDEAAAQRCIAASGEKKFTDLFNYPITSFLKLAFTAAEIAGPVLGGPDNVFRALGRQAVDDFLSSPAGKTMLLMAGRNPKRMISATPSGFKAAVSYGERSVLWLSDTRGRFTMKRDFMPHPYHEGVLLRVIEAMGAQNAKVTGTRTGPVDADYDISWT